MKNSQSNDKIVKMKWKLFCVVVLNLIVIGSIGCSWPFSPHPPVPLQLWEDHYMRISRGSPYSSSISHGEALSEPESMNHDIYEYPMDHLKHIISEEPEDKMLEESPRMDLENNMREFVDYSQREPILKSNRDNYIYRKRIKVHRPINQRMFNHKQEIKYRKSFGHPPRRYNMPEIYENSYTKHNFPNSVNDQLSQRPKKVVVLEEESNRQNRNSSNSNTLINNDKNVGNYAKNVKNEDVVSSQTETGNKKGDNDMRSITQNLKMPIEITSYEMQTPDGAVTQVTEMLYDVPNNPFKIPTSTPIVSPILPPSTEAVITATEDPRVTQTPYLDKGYTETEAGSVPIPPLDSAVTPKVDSITISPIKIWTSQRSTTNTPVTTWTSQRSLPTPPPRLKLPTAPSESGTRKLRKRISTQKPSTTTIRNITNERESGLSGAAIAGIVIGSMVSVMLLAGMHCK